MISKYISKTFSQNLSVADKVQLSQSFWRSGKAIF